MDTLQLAHEPIFSNCPDKEIMPYEVDTNPFYTPVWVKGYNRACVAERTDMGNYLVGYTIHGSFDHKAVLKAV